jgi:hypothetical protein
MSRPRPAFHRRHLVGGVLIALALVTVIAFIAARPAHGATPAAPAAAAAKAKAKAKTTIYLYTIKIAIKGGTTLTNADSGGYNGDMVQESSSGSYSLDGSFKSQTFYRGKKPKGYMSKGGDSAPVVVNGTWTDQGTKWVDVVNQITAPFTCGGTIGVTASPANMVYRWRYGSSGVTFTFDTIAQELWNLPPQQCPNDSNAQFLSAVDPAAYEGRLTVPLSRIGEKTITRQLSGPAAEHRPPSRCGPSCSLNVTWQGTVIFKRTRTFKVPQLP